MSYRLFLDDERDPPGEPHTWAVCRSLDDVRTVVQHWGWPYRVSFDHDLGDGPTGLDVARWMIERHLDGDPLPNGFSFTVHSMNPVGASNIRGLLDGFLRDQGYEWG